MTTRHEDKDQAEREEAARKDTPKQNAPKQDAAGVAEEDKVPVGRVPLLTEQQLGRTFDVDGNEVPAKQTINLVPTSDGAGNMVMVPADEPGHPDITTSPLT